MRNELVTVDHSRVTFATASEDYYAAHANAQIVDAVRDLAPPGDLTSLQTFSFEFNDVEMQYDSYRGLQVRLR